MLTAAQIVSADGSTSSAMMFWMLATGLNVAVGAETGAAAAFAAGGGACCWQPITHVNAIAVIVAALELGFHIVITC